ncbi:hypothetical protein HanXRQr2_Chr04g0160311 [Helianthus annuus]|uniref:Uncharacterized protein n=1 Tax=Helianthus annuus TaxID=4232 RepID=A0A9K3J792_HELAN|nr:hypothetical protein HanXRQr2_Chr04g0160311 [Helianthus annuus]KAJ0930861.1 hypothetical protein HanPSC8_Chr04g0154421 [Helianthus annuus]
MKTVGKVSFVFSLFNSSSSAIRFRNSLRNLESIDKSRSSIDTRKPRRIDWTVRQASNVGRTTRRLVVYTTTRFSAPGIEIRRLGFVKFPSAVTLLDSGGDFDRIVTAQSDIADLSSAVTLFDSDFSGDEI